MERTPAATACQSASSAGGGDRAALRHQDAPARRTGGERPARELRRRVGLRGIEGGRSHPSPERNVQHCVGWLMNLKSAPGGWNSNPSITTTALPGRDRARRYFRIASSPATGAFRTPARWRRNAIFEIAGSSSAWSFSAPRDAWGAQGRTCHGFRQRTVGSHVIALRIYGTIYGTNQSVQYLEHL